MKLQPLAMSSPLCPRPPRRTVLVVTAELCLRPQKKSLTGWLPLPQTQLSLSGLLFFFPWPHLHSTLISSTSLLKLQIASNPA